MEVTTESFSEDQAMALAAIDAWISDPDAPQIMTLGGYAGTGKSTLIQHIKGSRRGVRVCAPTGKAAHVLRTKGISDASTIHRMMYQPVDVCVVSGDPITSCECSKPKPDDTEQPDAIPAVQDLLQMPGIPAPEAADQVPEAKAPPACESEVQWVRATGLTASLIIVDEASMVSSPLYEDILSYGIKTLFVGDHGQLEPVGENPRLMANPELKLEHIHRQAEGSDVLRFAHLVRNGRVPQTVGASATVTRSAKAPPNVHEYDVVLCGRNSTRVSINDKIRRKRGFDGDLPCPGERVICLRNDTRRSVFNGMLATVAEVNLHVVDDPVLGEIIARARMTVVDDMGFTYRNLPFCPEQFGQEKTLSDVPRNTTLWDFGYCLTVHKSQGSEWDSVCVLEWIHPEWSSDRWRYTAATRAAKRLDYYVHPRRR